jgi:hypothetical protein
MQQVTLLLPVVQIRGKLFWNIAGTGGGYDILLRRSMQQVQLSLVLYVLEVQVMMALILLQHVVQIHFNVFMVMMEEVK